MNNVRNRHMKSMREILKAKDSIRQYQEDITERQERVVELQRSIEDEESVAKEKQNKLTTRTDEENAEESCE